MVGRIEKLSSVSFGHGRMMNGEKSAEKGRGEWDRVDSREREDFSRG